MPSIDPSTPWIALRADVGEDAADALGAFLMDHGAAGLILDATDDPEPCAPGQTRVEAHLPASAEAALHAALPAFLATLRENFPGTPLAMRTVPIPAVDWNATFRLHHRPVTIGRRLLVAPPWDVPAAPDREVLVIEPGMAFGTGQHATTRACLEEIEAAVDETAVATGLDVGTGSGLLAAAMARLGVPHVVAVDNDPAVLDLARVNLALNRASQVRVVGGTAGSVRGPFDLVVANLLLDVIVGDAAALAAQVAPGGRLILSGLLATQVEAAAAAFPGWTVTASRGDDPWRALRLARTTA